MIISCFCGNSSVYFIDAWAGIVLVGFEYLILPLE